MGFIRINTITFLPSPAESKSVTIMYRITSAPDIPTSYTTVTSNLSVPVGGVLATPFYINGLADATSYTVRVKSNCGTFDYEEVFITGVICPNILGIVLDDLIAYWGWKTTNTTLSEYEITYAAKYQYITATQDVDYNFSENISPLYLWVAEPLAASQKYKWADTVEAYNNGNIGTDNDLFGAPVISGGYRFYITQYKTQQTNVIKFKVS